MFSGIVETTAKALKFEKAGNGLRLFFKQPKGFKVSAGESVSIDGICSTVEKKTKEGFGFYFMPETLKKTTLSKISSSHLFNLERPLKLNSLVSGHLVSGHIDTIAKVSSIKNEKESAVLIINIPQKFTKYIIYKGSITVNGVSLTIVSTGNSSFTVSLIPYTLTYTNLGQLKVGDLANVEVDQVAKYLEKLVPR